MGRTSGLVATALLTTLLVSGCTQDAPGGSVDAGAAEPGGTAGSQDAGSAAPDGGTDAPGASGSSGVPDLNGAGVPEEPLDVPDEVGDRARAAAARYFTAVSSALADPSGADDLSDRAVAGAARRSLLAQAQDYASRGWRAQGEPVVTDPEVYVRGDDPSVLVVGVCVDSSTVEVLDRDGATVAGGSAAAPTRNLLVLEPYRGGSRVVQQSFRDDPGC